MQALVLALVLTGDPGVHVTAPGVDVYVAPRPVRVYQQSVVVRPRYYYYVPAQSAVSEYYYRRRGLFGTRTIYWRR